MWREGFIIQLRLAVCLSFIALLAACNLSYDIVPPARPVTQAPVSDWLAVAPGLEWRTYLPNDSDMAQLKVLRINPALHRFRAIYREREPLRLAAWQRLEPQAVAIINANFFDTDRRVLGLVISDGEIYGSAYQERGGTFAVQNGLPTVRANRSQPYRAGEALEQAVQGFPLLVEHGEPSYFNRSTAQRTRRTLIAADRQGNILMMISPFAGLSLADLSAYLPTTDLNIETAFNLDGGGSTMMAVPDIDYLQPSFDPVPTILALYPR